MPIKLTYERLHEVLRYEPDTGEFLWIEKKPKRRTDRPAGTIEPNGYRKIFIDGKSYLEHRLAWLYVHGYWPENDIDHIDRNPSNNRIKNLREVSVSCNRRNSKTNKNNKSGVTGVCWHEPRKKWTAKIVVDKKQVHLGIYSDFNNAVCARLAAEQALNWEGCDSTSDAYCYVRDNIQNGGDNGSNQAQDPPRKGTGEHRPADRVAHEAGG